MKIDFLFKHKKAEKLNKFNVKIKSFILYIKNKNLKFLVFKWILKEKKNNNNLLFIFNFNIKEYSFYYNLWLF